VDFMKKNYRPDWTYADFANQFTAEFYDPNQWADVFQASGAKYIVLTSKHHEGFTNWPSKVSFNWNSKDVGPKRDLVGELASAIRNKTKIHFGLYHSLFEWFNPLFLEDTANKFKTNRFVTDKTMPELIEIVNAYKPEVIWSDGDWNASPEYWNSTGFLAWLYNESPVKDTVVTNDRWGTGTMCHHGGYYTCHDRYNPGTLQPHKWENCMTIDGSSWGYARNSQLSDYLTTQDLINTMVETISCGGNLLMNVGPTHDGRILPIFEERLRDVGKWLGVNGEAIYASKPWTHQNDTVTPNVWYTSQKTQTGTSVYAIMLDYPKGNTVDLGVATPTDKTIVTMLGYSDTFSWVKRTGGGMTIKFPPIPFNQVPCQWAWTFKIDYLM